MNKLRNAKEIDKNNFISEFKIFIENNDDLRNKIKNIILHKIGRTDNIVKLIIEEKTINQNTIDFTSSILMYMKDGFNQQLENFLRKTENTNLFTTLFMLNVKENSEPLLTTSIQQIDDYSLNKTDEVLLKNKIFQNILKNFEKIQKIF